MLQYIIKLSISLAVLYIFYRAVLRPLTFYQCNRFYLLGYSLLSFAIPFINIAPWVQGKDNQSILHLIPVISYHAAGEQEATATPGWLQQLTITDWLLFVVGTGALILLIKLVLQYLSLRRIRSNAVLLKADAGIQLYETNAAVSPFSFGNAIYFNRQLHTSEELQRIIQHEFVHVQQKHTIDLLVAELLCVLNWYNPFAWLIRNSIRQNLEFIADNNVVANGIDKKEYQYLLLKVTGAPQYSIAGNFNLSNLKKRIAMMNKMKSTRLHLTKFLFVLPLMTLLLLAFRSNKQPLPANTETGQPNQYSNAADIVGLATASNHITSITDTLPPPPPPPPPGVHPGLPAPIRVPHSPNNKGYIVTIADNSGECIVLVKDKKQSIVKAITLTDWNKSRATYESTYGKILPPPPPPPEPGSPAKLAPPVEDGNNAEMPEPAAAPEKPQPAADVIDAVITPSQKGNNGGNPVKVPAPLKHLVKVVTVTPPPMYVVDGLVMPTFFDIESIPANSIASMHIIKGRDAELLYGSPAKNGVIIIKRRNHLTTIDTLSFNRVQFEPEK